MSRFKDCLIATRPWSFAMTAISVGTGTLLAAGEHAVSWPWFGLVLFGAVCFHAATNVVNDYFDTVYGIDTAEAPTARYRPHPLLGLQLTPRQLLAQATVLYGLTLAAGIAAAVWRSGDVAWIGALGFLGSLLYTTGPKLKYRALGELVVFLAWGPLMIGGAYAVQTGTLAARPMLIAVPFGVLVALVLFANNMRDIDFDARSGIRTVGILLGRRRSLAAFVLLMAAAYVALLAMVLAGIVTPWALLAFLSLPQAVSLTRAFAREIPDAADALTARLDTIFGVGLMAGLLVQSLVRG